MIRGEAPPLSAASPSLVVWHVIRAFGSGLLRNVTDHLASHDWPAAHSASPVVRHRFPSFPHPFTPPLIITIIRGITTGGRWSALRLVRGRRGAPAGGRPITHVLRLVGGVPHGHSEVVKHGKGGGPLATGTPTTHAAVLQRRATVPVRGGSSVSVPGAGPLGHLPPVTCAAGPTRAAVAPGGVVDDQAAPWATPPIRMKLALSQQARWILQRGATTAPGAARGCGAGSPPLRPAHSMRRGMPLAAGFRRVQP